MGCGKLTFDADVARVGRTLPSASSGQPLSDAFDFDFDVDREGRGFEQRLKAHQ